MATTASNLHLQSLLDLSARVLEADPVDMLNIATLSIMGRLKIVRACVLFPQHGRFEAHHRLCKGIAPFSLKHFPIDGITAATETVESAVLIEKGIDLLVPLTANGQLIAMLGLGAPLVEVADRSTMLTYLELARTIIGTAVHNAQMVNTLVEAKKELEARNLMVTTLFESARDFTGAKNLSELLRLLSYRLMGQLMVSSFAIYVKQADPVDPLVYANRTEAKDLAYVYEAVLAVSEPTIVADMPEDHPLRAQLEAYGIALVTPMTIHGIHRGAVATRGKLNARPFTIEELYFLEAIGSTAMSAIENERLMQEEAEKVRELEIASEIQRKLLPEQMPRLERIDISALTQSSRHVGGDYFDVIELDDHRLLFAIADVAGKGVPAALLMANVQAALNVLAWSDLPLNEMVSRINRLVCMNTEPEVFVTMFVGIVNTQTMGLEYVNAGHNPPILLRGDDVEMLTMGGVLTGVIPSPPPYQTGVGTIKTGDVLVLYTDGVTEARNGFEEFGVGSLVDVVREYRDRSASDIVDCIERAVFDFTQNKPEQVDDDTSILVIKVR